jgi:hypothetical protein
MAGIQSSSSVIANTAQITAGIAFNADIEDAMPAALTKSDIFTVSPLSPNTLRILVLVEASSRLFRLSFKVLSPEPLMSIITNAKAALWIQQGISVNDLPPVIDLDPMAGIQSSSSVIANTAQITAGC